MEVEGETRGFNLKDDRDWILKEKGEEGLEKVEKELERVGQPIDYKNLKSTNFYPAGLRALSLLATKKVFNLSDKEVRRVCALDPKTSLVVKLFARYFYSVSSTLKKAPEWAPYWRKGELKIVNYDSEQREAVVRLKGFDLHPLFCRCLEGYFKTVAETVTGSKKVSCRETECTFEGDGSHKYTVRINLKR